MKLDDNWLPEVVSLTKTLAEGIGKAAEEIEIKGDFGITKSVLNLIKEISEPVSKLALLSTCKNITFTILDIPYPKCNLKRYPKACKAKRSIYNQFKNKGFTNLIVATSAFGKNK